MADHFEKAWNKLLKARYISDISSEESDIEKVKRREHAKKLPDPNFISSDKLIPLPSTSKNYTPKYVEKTEIQKRQLKEKRHTNVRIMFRLMIIQLFHFKKLNTKISEIELLF